MGGIKIYGSRELESNREHDKYFKWAVRAKVKRRGQRVGEDEQTDQDCDRVLYPAPSGRFPSNPAHL